MLLLRFALMVRFLEAYFPAKQMYYRVMDSRDSEDYKGRSGCSPAISIALTVDLIEVSQY